MSGQLSARELLARAESEALARQKAGKPVLTSPAPSFNRAKDEVTLYLYDAIGGWFGIDPKTWVPEFNAVKAKVIHLRINSPGGAVLDSEAMRVAIRQHPANVIAHIDGLCASAATGLAIAANEVEMASGAMFMVHDPWGCCVGNAADMEAYAALLRKTTGNIVQTYKARTGQSAAQIRAWMTQETWFTAAEALEHGFVDRIFTPGQASNAADPGKAKRARALALAEISLKQI